MPPRSSIPIPNPAELDILAALWRLGPSTVREVHAALAKDTGYTTTLKQMQLMHDKRLLARSERFRSHLYRPAVSREQIQQQVAGDMLVRVFGSSARSLLVGALAAQPVSRQELAEIQKMLADYMKKKGKPQ